MQLSQHQKKCSHQKPTKIYTVKDGKYVCGKCSKHIKHQSNIKRHIQTCSKTKISSYKCSLWPKTFEFQCRLEKHLKYHSSQANKTCDNCQKTFKRIDHFESHRAVCVATTSDIQFVPSFCTSPTESSAPSEEPIVSTMNM